MTQKMYEVTLDRVIIREPIKVTVTADSLNKAEEAVRDHLDRILQVALMDDMLDAFLIFKPTDKEPTGAIINFSTAGI